MTGWSDAWNEIFMSGRNVHMLEKRDTERG